MEISDIIERIVAVPLKLGRRIIGVAGAPASGKSTLAEALAANIPNACVVPMDGFHRSNDDLQAHGLLARKGAAETFDASGFVAFVRTLRNAGTLAYPTFDRATDSVVENGGQVSTSIETIIVEGNYLLLDEAPWDALAAEWDLSVMIDVPLPVLRDRLVARWERYDHTPEQALARAEQNDIPNAKRVLAHSVAADLTV